MIKPGVETTVYEVITEPPSLVGAVKLIVAERLPVAVATTEPGADGLVFAGAAVNGEKLVVSPQIWPLE